MKIKSPKVTLVIPTIRDLHFLKMWGKEFNNCHLIVVEDREKPKVKIPDNDFQSVNHFSWKDIDNDLKKNSWIISRRNAGIRSYGFWKAYKMGAEVIITLDDDCYPTQDKLVEGHLENLQFKSPNQWQPTYPNPQWLYTRGFPYTVRNKVPTMISHGLWSGAIDLDAKVETKLPQLLNEPSYPAIRQIIPTGYFYPMSSMNLAFRKEVAVLMFFPMMGFKPDGSNWPYDRLDDIWAGVLSKKVLDHLGFGVINGSPFVDHRKRSKIKENFIKESMGMTTNESFWKMIAEVKLTKKTPKECYIELARKINFPDKPYFAQLKKAMTIWANLF